MRLIFNLAYKENCRKTFKNKKLSISFSLHNCIAYIKEHITDCESYKVAHSHNARKLNFMKIPQHKLAIAKKSPVVVSLKLYNRPWESGQHMQMCRFNKYLCFVRFIYFIFVIFDNSNPYSIGKLREKIYKLLHF